jgi:predicted dehydrogenase
MPALKMPEKSRIMALVSGHRDKAERMAAEYGLPSRSIDNYEITTRFGQSPGIDALYIALPTSMHADYAIRAAKAGSRVLCQKIQQPVSKIDLR